MKSIWNNWLKQAVFIYSVLYTVATISNSALYILNGQYEDPNGNWHELDRAIIVFIMILAYMLIKNLKLKNYWFKAIAVYIPTLLLVFGYVWMTGLREPLAPSAYRDIFINYTMGYVAVSVAGRIKTYIKPKNNEKK
ncbi:DUF6608 family protein [Peptoniphilus sp. oral taxon 386]|uniref:DUF6608 family protein n=1 Tax=Peptoniphilus sp. oral taxon 386 TaxID=652713 RepID=UPI0001DA9B26|nr:DUF6608 family protein [Peptoniphilus sp. oral taxon 386]EFI42112.1 hypothetical protein HMPREF0629_00752 [Peptoniphilus sp. oral taxon 386 str. F0131]